MTPNQSTHPRVVIPSNVFVRTWIGLSTDINQTWEMNVRNTMKIVYHTIRPCSGRLLDRLSMRICLADITCSFFKEIITILVFLETSLVCSEHIHPCRIFLSPEGKKNDPLRENPSRRDNPLAPDMVKWEPTSIWRGQQQLAYCLPRPGL